ncbi:DNA mismatch repair protein MutT [Pseudomonas taiwanensis]|uniref:DNA mismatch repair protein MutT n=1 Tax=Pseudomonas taiwanensis TaxID=470150 RepID=UPI0028E0547D|nr:DNA mismatch repair protein MutT [Pseudomonas taiwanensis]MDT8925455.1 DNA mismatch repair protein MutT [Pseudomonas taiwanensis]
MSLEQLHDKSPAPRHDPIVTLDAVIFCWLNEELLVLLEKRRKEPFKDVLAVPGGYIHTDTDKTIDTGRDRILREKVGFLPDYMEQLESVGGMDRDPRGWSVSIIYMCILKQDSPVLANLPEHLQLLPISQVTGPDGVELAFDHREVINRAYQRLASKTAYSSLPLLFMPRLFTMPMIINIHKAIMGTTPNKMSLHKRYKQGDLIRKVPGEMLSLSGARITDAYEATIVEPEMFSGSLGGGG